jgi:hypothetical protein
MKRKPSSQAAITSDFAADVEVVGNFCSVGVPLEEVFGYLSVNGSDTFAPAWHSLWLRLQNGVDLHRALLDFKTICADRWVDQFCEIVIACDTYQTSALSASLRRLVEFLRRLSEVENEVSQRIKSVGSVAWLALLSPWAMLVILLAKPENLKVFSNFQGIAIVFSGLFLSVIAKILSDRIAKVQKLVRVFS